MTNINTTSGLDHSRYLFENFPGYILYLHHNSIIDVNPNLYNTFQPNPSNILGSDIKNVINYIVDNDIDDVEYHQKLTNDLYKKSEIQFDAYLRQNNTHKIKLNVLWKLIDAHKNTSIMICRIISNNEFETRYDLLYKALNTAANSIVVTNKAGNIIWVNNSFSNSTGYSREEIIGKNPRLLKSGKHDVNFYLKMWSVILNGNIWEGEIWNRKKDGSIYPEDMIISPVIYDNQITHYIAIKQDITQRKNDQALLNKAKEDLYELNITKDKFFSIIAHDLKNPFHALMYISKQIIDNFENLNKNDLLLNLNTIHQSSVNGYQLLENLLTWSRSHTNTINCNPEEIYLPELLFINVNIGSNQAQNKSINIETENIDCWIFADKEMTNTIVRNLLTNAIKFTKYGGNIKINSTIFDMNTKEKSELNFPESDFTKFVKISVIDNGLGMSGDKIAKLFLITERSNSLGTDNEKGTGLGLLLCKEFVTKNNGIITVESIENQGSTFSIYLPMIESDKIISKNSFNQTPFKTTNITAKEIETIEKVSDDEKLYIIDEIIPALQTADKTRTFLYLRLFCDKILIYSEKYNNKRTKELGLNMLKHLKNFQIDDLLNSLNEGKQLFKTFL